MNTKPLFRFVIYFTGIYVLVLVTGSVGDRIYANQFRSAGKSIFHSFIDKGAIDFVELKKPEQPRFTTQMRLANMKEVERSMKSNQPCRTATVEVSSWYTGYLPTMLTIALIVSIPGLGWKRKAKAMLAGLVIIHLFIFAKLYIQVLYEFERNEWLNVVQFSPFKQQVMDNLHYLFVTSMGLNFIVPVLICIVTLFIFKNHLVGQPDRFSKPVRSA